MVLTAVSITFSGLIWFIVLFLFYDLLSFIIGDPTEMRNNVKKRSNETESAGKKSNFCVLCFDVFSSLK